MKISFVIPAYNEADNICHTIADIDISLATLSIDKLDYEIIIVDDHSTDDTYKVAIEQHHPNISIIRLSRRSGSHVALRAGLHAAKGAVVLCMAADGQDDPSALSNMIGKWEKGNDIVWALRETRQDESVISRIFTRLFYQLLTWLNDANTDIDLSKADFYMLDRKVVDAINRCGERNTSLFGLIIWLGFKQSHIFYYRKKRRSGTSKWNFKSKLTLAKDWIIAFSGIPLRLLTYSGFAIAGTGFIYAAYIIYSSLIHGSPVQGWSSVMTVILILGGGQAIMLGIIGEYLWRTMDETRKRPVYFIEKSNLPTVKEED